MQSPASATALPPTSHTVPVDLGDARMLTIQLQAAPSDHSLLDVWGPALFALVGVLVTLYAKWRSDAHERRLVLKRELYLKVADAMAEGAATLGRMSNPDVSFDKIMDQWAAAQASFAKAELVASMPLVEAMTTLRNAAGAALSTMFADRMKVDQLKALVKIHESIISQIQEKLEGSLAEQRKMSLDATDANGMRFERYQRDIQFQQDQQELYHNKNLALYAEMTSLVKGLGRRVVSLVAEIGVLQTGVLEVLRKELDLDKGFNRDEFLKIRQSAVAAATAFANDATTAVDTVMGRQPEGRKS